MVHHFNSRGPLSSLDQISFALISTTTWKLGNPIRNRHLFLLLFFCSAFFFGRDGKTAAYCQNIFNFRANEKETELGCKHHAKAEKKRELKWNHMKREQYESICVLVFSFFLLPLVGFIVIFVRTFLLYISNKCIT